jgi:large subunit ribosomal protein L21
MYAIIDDHGRQYTVKAGDLVDLDLKGLPEQQSITFDRVLMVRGDAGVKIGTPTVAGAKVVATVVGDVKGRKIIIRKYRRRKNYRRKQGHRQHFTRVRIESIEA